jgi:predicted acyltransferase
MATSQLNAVVDDKTSNPAGQKLPGRLMSLDVFRGATIAAMILVNDPGDGPSSYWPLKHSEWNGWTPTDLVFPFFLFIVGVAMAFSMQSRLQQGESRQRLLLHVLWRGVLLFAIGMLLNGFPNHYQLGSWRVYGVLQRIAICYVIAAILELWFSWRQQLAVIVVCLVGYWVLMRYVPVPGLGVPAHDFPQLDPDRNLAAWLDRKVLAGHLYEGTRDPEGILSTIPPIATALLGLLTGKWLRSRQSDIVKLRGMLASGIVAVVLGTVMNIGFPINKKLWTSSYVVFTAGLALICLSICCQVLDLKRWRGRWTVPFLVFGMNSIAAYVFSEVVAHLLDRLTVQSASGRIPWQDAIYERFFLPLASPPNASLLYALVYVFVCWIVMYVLYRKGIFLKI